MKRTFAALLVALSLGASSAAQADSPSDVRALYDQFAAAQNARDLAKVKTFLIDSPRFLWVSDGMSFWGAGLGAGGRDGGGTRTRPAPP